MAELRRRWLEGFRDLHAGGDWPPGARLRAEGLMEAAVLLSAGCKDDLIAAMETCYCEVFGVGFAEAFGADWQAFYPFPQIPAVMTRAPVYPTSSD